MCATLYNIYMWATLQYLDVCHSTISSVPHSTISTCEPLYNIYMCATLQYLHVSTLQYLHVSHSTISTCEPLYNIYMWATLQYLHVSYYNIYMCAILYNIYLCYTLQYIHVWHSIISTWCEQYSTISKWCVSYSTIYTWCVPNSNWSCISKLIQHVLLCSPKVGLSTNEAPCSKRTLRRPSSSGLKRSVLTKDVGPFSLSYVAWK